MDFNLDVDRFRTFFNIAKENNRKFVVKINDAYFLKYLSKDPKLDVPNIDDEDIIIYLPEILEPIWIQTIRERIANL
ncbi:MAG: hypothetical protein MRJ93_13315 [Nitrososphaeraceae archaeon]|nr:hypothetical protein [Nitrososphaeraceae archaeon]